MPTNSEADDPSPDLPARERFRWVSALTLALLASWAAFLRYRFLVRKPFWFDECFSVEVARLPWHDFARLMWRREANMSLYYLLLRGWLHLGSSPFFIRSLSVILSLAALLAVYWLACELFDRRVAIIALALMSCNAYHIRYAQEARSYALFVLLATLSGAFFVTAVRTPSRTGRRGYLLASVLTVYAHLYALLLLSAQWLSLRRTQEGMCSHSLRRSWIWIAVAVSPLVAFAAKTGAGPIRWIPRPGFHELLDFAEHIAGNDGLILLMLYSAACGAAILPVGRLRQMFNAETGRGLWQVRFLLIWLIFPPALVLVLSLARPIFLARYFIFCLPALVTLAAAGLAKLRPAWLLAGALAVILLLSVRGTFSYYDRDFDLERDASDAATKYVLDHAQTGDAILFHIAEARVPYEFFKSIPTGKPGRVAPEVVFPRHGERLDYRDFTGKPEEDFVRSLAGRYPRVWVVLMSNESAGQPDATTFMLNQVLGNSFSRLERTLFPQVEVRLYSQP